MNQYYGTAVRKPLIEEPVKEECVPEEIIAPVPVIEEQEEQEDELEDQETKEPEETPKKTWLTRLGNYINDLVNTPY
ncbi:MAG: hypothetical protein KBT15_05600 [Bacteroidales bacterium]|nr:hypothetical protein [Candidatus Minthousia equi]